MRNDERKANDAGAAAAVRTAKAGGGTRHAEPRLRHDEVAASVSERKCVSISPPFAHARIRHSDFLSAHRAHDYAFLVKRWRAVAKQCGLIMRPFAVEAGHRIYCVRSKRLPAEGGIYISAGIHGDEPA